MAETINLRKARKQKAKRDKEEVAQANRIAFGVPKSEREHVRAVKELERRQLDGHKRGE